MPLTSDDKQPAGLPYPYQPPAQPLIAKAFGPVFKSMAWFILLALMALMFTGARDSDYRVLFPNLSDKDGGAVIDKLAQMVI